jgi:hypothetical protein
MMKSLKFAIKNSLPKSLLEKLSGMISLTAIPKDPDAVISDLFPFRIEQDWNTYFELLNIPALLDPIKGNHKNSVNFIFFDVNGNKIFELNFTNEGIFRNTISIKDILIKEGISRNGTFACFHTGCPEWVKANSGFLAERGYSGYQNNLISQTRSYVHGNLDSIAKDSNGGLSMLGTSHWKKREYHLQHELTGPALYELAFVNTSKSKQKLSIDSISTVDESKISSEVLDVPSRGVCWWKREIESTCPLRIIIKSHLNLARPVVFRSTQISFDVFHG